MKIKKILFFVFCLSLLISRIVFSNTFLNDASLLHSSQLKNPFLESKLEEVFALTNLHFSGSWGGYITHPQAIKFTFNFIARSGIDLKNIESQKMTMSLRSNGKNYPINHQTVWKHNTYESQLLFPEMKAAGWYDLAISIQKLNSSLTFVLSNKVYFEERKVNLIFLVDNSASMMENDPENLRFRAIERMIGHSTWKKKINRVGVVEFSEQARILSPLVPVENFSLVKLRQLKIGGGTDFSPAFKKIRELYRLASYSEKTVLLFLTDGHSSLPYAEEHREVYQLGIPIFTIGLKSLKNQRGYNESFLKRIAFESGGTFSEANQNTMKEVYQKILSHSVKNREQILVYPNKKRYVENELIVLGYHYLGVQGLPAGTDSMLRVEIDPQTDSTRGEILFQTHHQQGGEIGFAHFQNSREVKNLVQRVVINFFDTKNNAKRMIKQYRLDYYLIDQKPAVYPDRALIFENILPNRYEIRYLNLKTSVEQVDFIELDFIRRFPQNENFDLFFPEIPFRLQKNQFRKQAVVFQGVVQEEFNVQSEKRRNDTRKEGYLLIKSSEGYFLNNLTYTLTVKSPAKKLSAFRLTSKPGDERIWLIVLIVLSIFFLINLTYLIRLYRVKK